MSCRTCIDDRLYSGSGIFRPDWTIRLDPMTRVIGRGALPGGDAGSRLCWSALRDNVMDTLEVACFGARAVCRHVRRVDRIGPWN